MKMFMFKVLCIMKMFTKMFMFMHLHENDILSTNIFHRYMLTVLRICNDPKNRLRISPA